MIDISRVEAFVALSVSWHRNMYICLAALRAVSSIKGHLPLNFPCYNCRQFIETVPKSALI